MIRGSRLTTALIAAMVALSLVAAAGPAAIADDGPTQTVETLENDDDLYLSFGADLGEKSLEEYIEKYADDNPSGDEDAEVIQYQEVEQVNIHEEGEAVSMAIGGGQATAIQEVNQRNANSQIGEATAERHVGHGHETTFKDVDDVYLIMGNGGDKSFDGWGIADKDGEVTVSQTAEASVTQGQEVGQANVNQNTTALAVAENESSAVAIQMTEQSNLNVQEASATAANVYGADLKDTDRHDAHKKGDDELPPAAQDENATVEQAQAVEQVNVYEEGAAVAIAVGENASATAVQITDQSNLNEQIGTAEAINVLMQSAGMNVATANIDGSSDIVNYDGTDYDEPKDKKGDDPHADGDQVADASVTQYQSAEQANINLNSSAQAIATNGSQANAVQLNFQQNINAQVASADVLNVFLEENDKLHDTKLADGHDYDGLVLTNTTTATVNGDGVEDADRTTFDYDGNNDQLNDVDQYSTAEIEQNQKVTQINLHSSNAIAVAEDDGAASAVQMTIQENENVQVTATESTSVEEGPVDDGDEHPSTDDETDHTADDADDETDHTVDADDETDHTEKEESEEMPGFGVAVAVVAVLAAAMLGLRSQH